MEEDLAIPLDFAKNGNISVTEGEKLKDFVQKHFGDVTDININEESSSNGHKSSTKKEKLPLNKTLSTLKQGAVFSGKILSFGCSLCKDNCTFSPNDLLKHFQALHQGTLPTYPCDLCDFFTNEFPALQRHRIEHRNTLVTCELCNDDVQYSLLLLTRHYIMCHSLNGQFNCDWCEFTTVDAGTFVQHIHHHNECHWKCPRCRHISLNEDDHHEHTEAHSGTFPFTCQICGYGAARREFLKKHTAAVHKVEADRRTAWTAVEDCGAPTNIPAALKLLLKKNGELQEASKLSSLNSLSATAPYPNGRLLKPETSSDGTHLFTDGTLARKDNKSWSKASHTKEQPSAIMLQECENVSSADAGNNANGLTVFMVKNKISLPPNCTTKVMGFKVVDGKKHLVLKVIPTAKQELSIQNQFSVESVCSLAPNPALVKDSTETGEFSDSKNTASHCLAVSPRSASSFQMDQDDIMAVKVKIEEEETSICSFQSGPNADGTDEQPNPLLNRALTPADAFYSITNELENDSDQSHPDECTDRERWDTHSVSVTCNSDKTSLNCSTVNHTTILCASKGSDLISPSKVTQEAQLSQPTKTDEKCIAVNELTMAIDKEKSGKLHGGSSACDSRENTESCPWTPPKRSDVVRTERKHHNGLTPPLQLINSVSLSKNATNIETCVQSSPNHGVFTFHNYSKETFNTPSVSTQIFENESEHSADEESVCDLALGEMKFTESEDGDLETDGAIAGVDNLLDGGNPDSVLQDFNIIKIEEECLPICPKPPETKSNPTTFGTFVEEHSDAIISQQLKKERMRLTGPSNEFLTQTKTTLQILQLPDGKQPVLLRATDKQFSLPVQVKATPGFKLLTNSANPQINVSYMKPGLQRSLNTTTVSPNSKAGVPAAKSGLGEKGATLVSAVQPGVTAMPNHYVLKGKGFKDPAFCSSTAHHPPTEKAAKTQPTCFLVQRSVPFLQGPGTSHLKLTNTQLALNSQPILAMPVSVADKAKTLQSGRQAILLRYISPPKSGLLLNNHEAEIRAQCSQTSESSGGKVIFKIVSPTGSLLTNGEPISKDQPLFLAARPQTQCFLVSSNKPNATVYNGVKKLFHIQSASQNEFQELCTSASQMNVNVQSCKVEKPVLAPRSIRPPSQRKRCRKASFDELPALMQKSKRIPNKVPPEKEASVLWKPVAKEVERTLRLFPVTSDQQIKCPRRYQPVVVLNHPDADIPEVANIMKVVTRYKGAVTKVALSKKTVQALSELDTREQNSLIKGAWPAGDDLRPRLLQTSVRERFLLKMKLRKKSKKKYEVVKTLADCKQSPVFECWFCGRLFNSQEDWIGHGQRHLMEATRDWNKLF